MRNKLHLYYQGKNTYPPTTDEECWKFCEGLEASGFYSNTALQWLGTSVDDPDFVDLVNASDSQGIIFLSTEDTDIAEKVAKIKRPMVFTDVALSFREDIFISHPDAYLLTKNEDAAVNMLARHLIDKGHRRLFFLKSIENTFWENNRLHRFLTAVKNLSPHVEVIDAEHDSIAQKSYLLKMNLLKKNVDHIDVKSIIHKLGEQSLPVSLLRLGEIIHNAQSHHMKTAETHLFREITHTGCTAIVGSNDRTAIRFIRFCEENNIGIPEDISVAAFDNSTTDDHRLSSIDFGYHTGGTIAANIITQPEIRQHQKSSIIELPCRLIDRNTVRSV